MKKYVLVFVFENSLANVLMIRKLKPEYQKGLLNGLGGKIEEGELPIDAAIREVKEESNGIKLKKKDIVGCGSFIIGDSEIFVFGVSIDREELKKRHFTKNKEGMLFAILVNNIGIEQIVPNVQWLASFAKHAIQEKKLKGGQVNFFVNYSYDNKK